MRERKIVLKLLAEKQKLYSKEGGHLRERY